MDKKLLLVAPLMLLLISGTAYAKNNVSEIDISVTVRDDGSAYVVQNWQGYFRGRNRELHTNRNKRHWHIRFESIR